MAIEFNCPYCTATLKVPDASMGKQGKCPKCGADVLIPKVEIPTAPVAASPIAPVPSPAPAPPASELETAFPPDTSLEIRTTEPTIVTARRKRKRGPSLYGILVPLVMVSALATGGYWIYKSNLPSFQDKLPGTPITSTRLVKSLKPNELPLGKEDAKQLIGKLEVNDVGLTTSMMSCRVGAMAGRMTIEVEPGLTMQIVRVAPLSMPAVKKYYLENIRKFQGVGREELKTAVTAFQREYSENNGYIENIMYYRDAMCLNVLAGGLGSRLEAIVEQPERKAFPCVFQDESGRLYFVVPAETQRFVVNEMSIDGEERLFPEEFRINVTVDADANEEDAGEEDAGEEDVSEEVLPEETGTSTEEMSNDTQRNDETEDAASMGDDNESDNMMDKGEAMKMNGDPAMNESMMQMNSMQGEK